MLHIGKNTKKNTVITVVITFCIFVNVNVFAHTNAILTNEFSIFTQKNTNDTLPPTKPNILKPTQAQIAEFDAKKYPNKNDSIVTTIDTINIKFSKDSLESTIVRKAVDSAIYFVKTKKFVLYGKATTTYTDNNIDADFIELDNENNIVTAIGEKDSTGKIATQITMQMADQNITADSIRFNTKTSKAVSYNSRTKNDELYFQSEKTKLLGDRKSFYGYNNRFTTCNLDEPHFCFHTKKLKVISGKLAVSNLAYPEFEGVPLPVGIPFGIYPMQKGRHGGLLPPQFTTNEEQGVGLEGLGYYLTFGEYWDIIMRTNIYSYGSWSANISPTYRKRYKYNGAINLSFQKVQRNFKGDADFTKNNSFAVSWSHSSDTKARPGVNFNANVNVAKSSYNLFNLANVNRRSNNRLNSSITYSKTWQDKPYNITISANHSQNTTDNTMQLNLPEVSFAVQTQYPFKNVNNLGEQKWYEKIGIGYQGNLRTQMTFRDNQPIAAILKAIKDTFQWGADHNIPLTVTLPSLGPVQISPGITYQERTYGLKILRQWNETLKKVDTTIEKGFYEARQVGFSISAASAVYGTFNIKNKKGYGVEAIRHIMRPSVAINYTPNTNKKYYQRIKVDTLNTLVDLSVFERNLYSPFGNQEFGGLSFGIDNNVELKKRTKGDSTAAGIKKVKLIDGLSINSGYNFLADSFKLGTFNISFRTSLAEGKFNITAGGNVNPYQVNAKGVDINKYAWKGRKLSFKSLGRLTGANLALSTQFRGGEKGKKKNAKNTTNKDYTNQATEDMTPDEQLRMSDYINSHPAEFVDFTIPWDVSLSFAVSLSTILQPDYSFKKQFDANVNFNGNFALTPKWKVGGNGFYDLRTNKLQQLQMFISREMHCWQLSINVVPLGAGGFKSFNITLNPKAGILRDLKVNRTRYFYGE